MNESNRLALRVFFYYLFSLFFPGNVSRWWKSRKCGRTLMEAPDPRCWVVAVSACRSAVSAVPKENKNLEVNEAINWRMWEHNRLLHPFFSSLPADSHQVYKNLNISRTNIRIKILLVPIDSSFNTRLIILWIRFDPGGCLATNCRKLCGWLEMALTVRVSFC